MSNKDEDLDIYRPPAGIPCTASSLQTTPDPGDEQPNNKDCSLPGEPNCINR